METYRAAVIGLGWMGLLYDLAKRVPDRFEIGDIDRPTPSLDLHRRFHHHDHPGEEGNPTSYSEALSARPETELIAAADRDPRRLKAFTERYGIQKVYASAEEMLRTERPDIVAVCTNTATRADLTCLAVECGARAIVTEKPMAHTLAEAERMVEACLYPPAGRRSFGPIRVNTRDGVGYFLTANERVAVIPMIETREALENVEAIAATPGVDALFVGPFDLSIALGLMPGDNDGEPVFDDAIDKIVAAARKHGRALAVLSNAEVAPLRLKQGFQMVSVSTDSNALVAGSAASLAAVRERVAKELSDAE